MHHFVIAFEFVAHFVIASFASSVATADVATVACDRLVRGVAGAIVVM